MALTLPTAAPRIHRANVGGATLITVEDHSLPVVRFAIGLRRGSIADPEHRAGLTRVLFDALLRGTRRRPRVAFNAALEEMGSVLQPLTGAQVALMRGACLRRHFSPTLALAGEALAEPAFAPEELAPLVDETIETLRAERDEDDTIVDLFLRRALYRGHPLSRPPQGLVADLEALTRDELTDAHEARMNAADLTVVIAGDVTPSEAAAELAPIAALLPPGPESTSPLAEIEAPDGLRILVVDKPERSQVQLRIARPALDGHHPDAYGMWLGTTAFGGTFTSRFTKEVRDVRGWSYQAHADFDRFSRFKAPVVLRSAPAVGQAVDCLELELSLYRELAAGRFKEEELAFARTYLLNRYPLEVASPADMLLPMLRNELLGLPPEEILAVPARLEAIKLDEVGAVCARHLHPEKVVVALVATAAPLLPLLEKRFPSASLEVVDFRDGLQLEPSDR